MYSSHRRRQSGHPLRWRPDRRKARFPDPALYPRTPVQRLVGCLVECYADEFLILPGLHYRWSFAESETKARAELAIMSGDADSSGKFADAVKLYTRDGAAGGRRVSRPRAHRPRRGGPGARGDPRCRVARKPFRMVMHAS